MKTKQTRTQTRNALTISKEQERQKAFKKAKKACEQELQKDSVMAVFQRLKDK